MPCHTITESAKLAGVSRRTIQRYIRSGKLSARNDEQGNPKLDTSELLRIFPNLSHPKDESLSQTVAPTVTPSNLEPLLLEMMQEIKALRAEVKELKEAKLLEYKPQLTEVIEKETTQTKYVNKELDYIPTLGDFFK